MSTRAEIGTWKFGSIAREAAKNVFIRGSRLVFVVVMAVAISGLEVGLRYAEVAGLKNDLEAAQQGGYNVLVFQSADADAGVAISRSSCEGLNSSLAVERAGLIIAEGRKNVFPFGTAIPVYRASSTLIPELTQAGAVVGSSLEVDAMRPTFRIEETIFEGQLIESQPQGLPINGAIAFPLRFDDVASPQCIVVLHRFASGASMLPILQLQLDASGSQVSGLIVESSGVGIIESFLRSPLQLSFLILGVIGGLIVSLTTRNRRGELATYLLVGSSRSSVALLLLLEAGFVSIVALLCSLSFQVVAASPTDSAFLLAMLRSTGLALGLLVGASSGLLTIIGRPIDLAKERT
jgi:hypothetical protein